MGSFDLATSASSDEVVARLRKTGVIRIEKYLPNVSEIRDELLSIYDKMESNYQFGKVIRSDNLSWDTSRTPMTTAFFRQSEWMHNIATGYQALRAGFQKDLFSSHDYLACNGTGPQGWAHFDRLQRFKFFLYVSDVDENCGPICAAPGTHKLTKAVLRKRNRDPDAPDRWRFGRYYGDPAICTKDDWAQGAIDGSQNHYPDVEYELISMVGQAGTLVVFDSDVFHCGGAVKPGHSRMVARAHSW